MSLSAGTRLGAYEILSLLGVGGMGEVYRARDTRLDRLVALKILPEELFEAGERRERFAREARTLASLNHPAIATLYSFEETPGSSPASSRHLLAMELVEGEDLAERLRGGAILLEEALSIAVQIAEGLEAAHEKGIVHRDLKPANVKVTADGKVKLLDLGLAKALGVDGGSSPDVTSSPTLTARATAAGVILGTAAYTSPEQARGRPLDRRADVWAFGCVVFEMLTGRRAFEGETVSDTLAAVLRAEPDFSLLPPGTPSGVAALLRKTLRKDPRQRLHDIADARLELAEREDASAAVPYVSRAGATGRGARLAWGVAAAALLVAAALGTLLVGSGTRVRDGAGDAIRLQFVPPKGERLYFGFKSFAISPDGSRLAYVVEKGVSSELRIRRLDAEGSTAIRGTEGVLFPFFSPDGEWMAFSDPGTERGPDEARVSISRVDGRDLRPVHGMQQGDALSGWYRDSNALVVFDRNVLPAPVDVLDIRTGARTALLKLMPPDPVGISGVQGLVLSTDGGAYAYNVIRQLSELYVIDGVC